MNPPANAMVLCVDEKSQIQALNRKQPLLPMFPGSAELEQAIMEFIEANNDRPRPFVWTKTADQILAAIERLCGHLRADD